MKKGQKLLLFISIFLLLVVLMINFSTEKVTGKVSCWKTKRGYIFDRNLNPIAISLETYKAYYLLKGFSFLNFSDLRILKTYLGSSLNLPKNGVILLSEDLSLEEVEKLKKDKNVIIEKTFKRKILQPYLKFLIGETFNEHGVSGLEKMFDEHLSMGNPLVLSIDLNLENKIYNIINKFNLSAFGIAIFDLETAEVLGYLESENFKVFDKYYPLNLFGIPEKEIKNFSWTLGENPTIKENGMTKINMWHLVKWYMEKICGYPMSPTLLSTKTKICKLDLERIEKREYNYINKNNFITLALKENKMIVLSIIFDSNDNANLAKNKIIKNSLLALL